MKSILVLAASFAVTMASAGTAKAANKCENEIKKYDGVESIAVDEEAVYTTIAASITNPNPNDFSKPFDSDLAKKQYWKEKSLTQALIVLTTMHDSDNGGGLQLVVLDQSTCKELDTIRVRSW